MQLIFVELTLKGVTEHTAKEIYATLRQLQHHHGVAEIEQGWSLEGTVVIQISSPVGSNHAEIVIAVGKIAQEHRSIEVNIDQFPAMLERLAQV